MGDRIAQIIFEKIKTPQIKELDSLEGTDRGAGGYGSTGKDAVQQNKEMTQDPSLMTRNDQMDNSAE